MSLDEKRKSGMAISKNSANLVRDCLTNRWQAILGHLSASIWGISIAFVFHSLNPALALSEAGAQCAPYNGVDKNLVSRRMVLQEMDFQTGSYAA